MLRRDRGNENLSAKLKQHAGVYMEFSNITLIRKG